MKTTAGTVKSDHKPIFINRVTKPHVFSKMIQQHGAALKEENHLSVVPHQILNPDYDPQSPKLKVEYRQSTSENGSIRSNSDLSDRSHSLYSAQTLPQRKPYRPRSERSRLSASASLNSSQSVDSQDLDLDFDNSTHRYTIMELEALLIREKSKLKKIQLESDASRKVYAKTKSQMHLKVMENQRKVKKLMDSIQLARQNLEVIQATIPAAPTVRHRTNSSSSSDNQQASLQQPQTIQYTPVSSTSRTRLRTGTFSTTNTPFVDNGTTDFI